MLRARLSQPALVAQVNGGASHAGIAAFSVFYQTFSQVPEPGTLTLLVLGGLAAMVRRRKT